MFLDLDGRLFFGGGWGEQEAAVKGYHDLGAALAPNCLSALGHPVLTCGGFVSIGSHWGPLLLNGRSTLVGRDLLQAELCTVPALLPYSDWWFINK